MPAILITISWFVQKAVSSYLLDHVVWTERQYLNGRTDEWQNWSLKNSTTAKHCRRHIPRGAQQLLSRRRRLQTIVQLQTERQ